MSFLITILSFVVVIPFAFGVAVFNRIPKALQFLVMLCGAWFITEIFMFVLRMQGAQNAFLSYPLTAVEIMLFVLFYLRATRSGRRPRRTSDYFFAVIFFLSIPLVVFDWYYFGTPLNTFSLSVEYILITGMALYLYAQTVSGKAPADFSTVNLTLLFYFLSSFPYFVAWEWLRTSNLELLKVLSWFHLYVHAICYLVFTFTLWRSSLSYSVR
jgi:hypothetical protein